MSAESLIPAAAGAPLRPNGRLGFGCGRRFLLLLSMGALWMLPAFWVREFLYGVLCWDALLVAAWFVDFFRLPRPASITAERSWPEPPALLSRGTSRLRLVNRGGTAVEIAAVDDLPPGLRAVAQDAEGSGKGGGEGEDEVQGHLPAAGEAILEFPLYPRQRGDHRAGIVYLRYESSLGFAQRWASVDIPQVVRVFPQMDPARRSTLYLTRTRRIELEKRLLRQRGMGREFESLREYRRGDEFRDICWSATARRGKWVTKVHQAERSQPVWLLIDAGRLLRTRVGELTKLDYVANAALGVAQLAIHSGDKVGVIVYGRSIQQNIPPGQGGGQIRRLLHALAQMEAEASEADHLFAAAALQKAQRRRSLVIWMTDLAETAMTPEVVEAATVIMHRHLVLFVVIGQPELAALAGARPHSAREMYESVAAQELVQRRELLLARLRERGALTLELAPRMLSDRLLNEYLRVKDESLI